MAEGEGDEFNSQYITFAKMYVTACLFCKMLRLKRVDILLLLIVIVLGRKTEK